ncbi:MAG: hypothetical protein DI535_03470 [Citrobacter freundii]|nr:MAG: hypothetical protein DI535_03470 [Citrobacter freundii]
MNDPRGSIWRKCDFHIHTPLSALENNFTKDFDAYVKELFTKAIEKNVKVIGITDYFTIDGYKKIRTEYLENEPKLRTLFTEKELQSIREILVLPNVEFRLNKIIQINKIQEGGKKKTEAGRVNFHVLLSNELSIKQMEENFLHNLNFVYEAEPAQQHRLNKLKVDNLRALGKRLKEEQPGIEGEDLRVGMTHAVVDDQEIIEMLTGNNDFLNKYLTIVPSDEDLSEIQWKSQDGLTRKILLSAAHAFMSANPATIAFGLGEKAESLDKFLKEFKTQKPCLWGSDAHNSEKLFEPDLERYCWVKADPTFEGIRQILFEPKGRVFIGKYPPLRARIQQAKHCYLKSLRVNGLKEYDQKNGKWFSGFVLPLGFELTALIGNKGKGKSAIADILGLLGNAHVDKADFSFLNSQKFCQKGYAENFSATLEWLDQATTSKGLAENVDLTNVERIKYLPQSYLEKLCNSEDGRFQKEINKVVFSRLEDSEKLGKRDFDELREHMTSLIAQKIVDLKNDLEAVNKELIHLLEKKEPAYRQVLENKRQGRKDELAAHEEEKKGIVPVPNPALDASLSTEQKLKVQELAGLNEEISRLEQAIEAQRQQLAGSRLRLSELGLVLQELVSTKERFETWQQNRADHYAGLGLDIRALTTMTITTAPVDQFIKAEQERVAALSQTLSEDQETAKGTSLVQDLQAKRKAQELLGVELAKPLRDYQEYEQRLKAWEVRRAEIIGTSEKIDSLVYFETELAYIDTGVDKDLEKLVLAQEALMRQIFAAKQEVQAIYNKIKTSISEVLKEYSAEQNISLETAFKIDRYFYNRLFDYVNKYGDLYQVGDQPVRDLVKEHDFDKIDDIIAFVKKLLGKNLHYKEGRKGDLYNYLTTLAYLEPEYDLRLNGKSLKQLSPGEKGGLLLIFYLVLDKDNKPLVIDQPEDNLDNQSVAEILVPYIKTAKSKRQIIMVTHNPNLAIVADAEQIVYMDIDKEKDYAVKAVAGAIENPAINKHIVDILEGKMQAFNNRRLKYREEKK